MLTAVWNNNNISFTELINIREQKDEQHNNNSQNKNANTHLSGQLMRRSVTIVASFSFLGLDSLLEA